MGLKPAKRQVDAIVRDLFAPLLGADRSEAGWELLGWDAEQGLCLTFRSGNTFILIEFEDRDDSRDCYARTANFNVFARRPFEAREPLTVNERDLVDRVVSAVRTRENRLPVFERPVTGRKRAAREILVDRVLMPEGKNHYYINPYVGCMIGCPYCYVAERADLSRRLEGLPRMSWGHYVDVKVNAAEVLEQEVRRLPPGVVRMSPILTDPYQAAERRYRITRGCLEVLLEAGFSVAILTRAARITEDLELLKRFPKALVGFSIPTDADRYRLIFEPGADPVDERIEALKACREAGLNTMAFIQPMLPMDVDRLVERVAPLVRAVRIDRMYGLEKVVHLYQEHGLERAATDGFFEETGRRLREGFAARGVNVHDMDELDGLL